MMLFSEFFNATFFRLKKRSYQDRYGKNPRAPLSFDIPAAHIYGNKDNLQGCSEMQENSV